MRAWEILLNGGWATTKTQSTKITPQIVKAGFELMVNQFVPALNKFLQSKQLGPTKISRPGGSATYYQRDLDQQPDKEYGDIDVQFHIPRIDDTTSNSNVEIYKKAIQEFCQGNQTFETDNGTNIIIPVANGYVQVDLVYSYYDAEEWTKALAPAWNVKGVLCNSLYSSLGEALSISFGGGNGIQVKTKGGEVVPFKTVKDVDLHTISMNPKTWAVDIAKYFGGKMVPGLKSYPGMLDEIRVTDIVNSIRGIAESLEKAGKSDATELLNKVKNIYLAKIEKAATSSKFDKAATPEAIAKAEKTKAMLLLKSQEFAQLFGV
jgi:hypothetical protein